MTGSDINTTKRSNLIPVNFTGNGRGKAIDSLVIAPSTTISRADVEGLSQKNDPFGDLATRLTDFFSNPASENNKAQKIKNACWDDLTLDKQPVFEPNFENLTGAKFSKNPEGGLTITLSPDHVDQGYLQVLSDLTLVAEVIKRSIYKDAEDPIGGFVDAKPIEKIKIITHPDRNLVIPASKITKNLNYQIGPEFKFIESETYGLIPVASGMFNLDDVQKGKLKTRNYNNSKLEQFAFNGSATNTLAHVADLRKIYFTPYNTMFVSPMNESHRAYRIIQDAFGYREPTEKFEKIIKEHNNGPIYDHMIPPAISRSTEASHLDASYTGAVREMGLVKEKDSETFIHRNPDIFTNEPLSELTKLDSLKLLTHGVNLTNPEGHTILPKYAFSRPELAERIQKII
jgi:hypothetical protein